MIPSVASLGPLSAAVKASGDSTYRREGEGRMGEDGGGWGRRREDGERRGAYLMVPMTTWVCFSASDFLSVPRNQLQETVIPKARVASAILVE